MWQKIHYLCKKIDSMEQDFELEWQKMLNGEVYAAGMPQFLDRLMAVREKIRDYNDLRPSDREGLATALRSILGSCGEKVIVNQPFRCDYGENISIGNDVIINFNCTILDEAHVSIGNHVFIGPNVSIYTACHPLEAAERNRHVQWAEGVTIGNDVWIGGSVTILPGVHIGDGCVIGSGAVVVRDIPARHLAVGNPARPIRKI